MTDRDRFASLREFTPIEIAVVVAIVGMIIGLLWPAISAAMTNRQAPKSQQAPQRTVLLETVQHDGHWWVISSASYTVPSNFIHHPNCPCKARTAEVEP